MMTIEQITKALNLDSQTVYGLMAFLVQVGAATAKNAPSGGKRGKPPKLYTMAANAPGLVADFVSVLQLHQHVATVAAPTTHDQANDKLEDSHAAVTV